ncbi:hypothetical protein ACA910_004831 [Epithemia clementina (nom. ined.)]
MDREPKMDKVPVHLAVISAARNKWAAVVVVVVIVIVWLVMTAGRSSHVGNPSCAVLWILVLLSSSSLGGESHLSKKKLFTSNKLPQPQPRRLLTQVPARPSSE